MIDHLSASSIKTYQQCPRRWRYRYLDRLAEPTTGAIDLGTRIHRLIESWWRGEHQPPVAGTYRYLETYRRMKGAVHPSEVAAVELELRGEMPGIGLPLVGYLDCLTKDGRIIDIKTSGRHWVLERALSELQPAMYWFLCQANGIEPAGAEFHLLVGGNNGPIQGRVMPIAVEEEYLERHWRSMKLAWLGIQAGEFPAHRTILCDYCPHQQICASEDRIGPDHSGAR